MPSEKHDCGGFVANYDDGQSWCAKCGAIRHAPHMEWYLPLNEERLRSSRTRRPAKVPA